MRLLLVNLTPENILVRYMLSSYSLKAYLEKYGGDDTRVRVLDVKTSEPAAAVAEKILALDPDCIGFSCYSWNIDRTLETAAILRKKTRAALVLGGPEISLGRIGMLDDPSAADYYCLGEGERKLLRLVEYLAAEGGAGTLKLPSGIARRNGRDVEYTEVESNIIDLDEIPSPYLSGIVDEELYAGKMAYLETQRGCRNKCGYCVYHKITESISYYSLERIYEELKFLLVDKRIKILFVVDAVFSSDLERSKKILRRMLEIGDEYGIPLPLLSISYTYDSVDGEFLELAADVGKKSAVPPVSREYKDHREQGEEDIILNNIGIQSFNDESLRAAGRRKVDWPRYAEFHRISKKIGLAFKIDLIFGLPYETAGTFFRGVGDFLEYLEGTRHNLHIQRLQVLPGSDLEALAGKYRMVYRKNSPRFIISTNTMTEMEMNRALKLVAILSRVVNSPLRQLLVDKVKGKASDCCLRIIENIYDGIISSPEFGRAEIAGDGSISEFYWYRKVYEELPEEWLRQRIERYEIPG